MSRIVQEGNLHFRRVRGRQSSLVVPTHSQIVNGEVDVKEHYDWKEDYVKLPSGIYVSDKELFWETTIKLNQL